MSWWDKTMTLGEKRGCKPDCTFLELLKLRNDVFSQNGEDGIINRVLDLCSISDGWACEFGAWDGVFLSNSYNLVKNRAFKAVLIEGDASRFKSLIATSELHPGQIIPINSYVSDNSDTNVSLDYLLSTTQIPNDFDLLSIDIDSYDYLVWKNLKRYKPKVVVIEINSGVDPLREDWYSGNVDVGQGTSYLPMLKMGKDLGYTLLCHTGNMIFLRDDLLKLINYKAPENETDPFLTFWREF